MANDFYELPKIANEFIRIMENELVLGKIVGNDQLDTEKVMHKGTIKVRRQSQYLGQMNNLDLSAFSEDVIDGTVTVQMDTTWSDKVSISALDRSMSFDRYSDQVIKPMARRATEVVEKSIADLYPAFYLFDGTPGTVPSTFLSLADAGAFMSDAGNALGGRVAVHSPTATAKLSDTIKSSFVNSNNKVALEKAMVGNFGGFDNYQSAFAPTHTVGIATGTPTVNGAAQNVTYVAAKDSWSQSLITTAWTATTTGILKAGDVFTIAGVFMVNPNTKTSTGRLQTFTVLADANSGAAGATTLTISPPMIVSGPYQTVTAAPANGAAITVKTGTGGLAYRQSLLLDPAAIALATRPLDIPGNAGLKTSTKSGEFVTMSVSEWVDGNTLALNMRFDMLFKPVVLDPRRGMRLTN